MVILISQIGTCRLFHSASGPFIGNYSWGYGIRILFCFGGYREGKFVSTLISQVGAPFSLLSLPFGTS